MATGDQATNLVPLPIQAPVWDGLWASFERSLKAENVRPNTVTTYAEGGRAFRAFLIANGHSTDPARIDKPMVQEWLISLQESGRSPATVRNRFQAVARFYRFLIDEGEVETSPMPKPPRVPEKERAVITEDEIAAILKTCAGKTFEQRRDNALLMLAIDSGLRRSELAALKVDDLDLAGQQGQVIVKGGRTEWFFWGVKTNAALDRYLRVRARHADANLPNLWLSARRGGLADVGIHQMVLRRVQQAGITRDLGGIGPHLFRHYFAHELKSDGASDEMVMKLGRWRDPRVMARYGRGAAIQRARAWHTTHSPADKL
jgi:site-specific recombinase XerD